MIQSILFTQSPCRCEHVTTWSEMNTKHNRNHTRPEWAINRLSCGTAYGATWKLYLANRWIYASVLENSTLLINCIRDNYTTKTIIDQVKLVVHVIRKIEINFSVSTDIIWLRIGAGQLGKTYLINAENYFTDNRLEIWSSKIVFAFHRCAIHRFRDIFLIASTIMKLIEPDI